MNKKIESGLAIILPNKKINTFVIFVIVLGIISGTIFLLTLNDTDKELVVNQISLFMNNIDSNNINNFNAFKNSLIENLIFIILIWIFGMSIIGVVFNIFAIYLKGFILGFSLASFFYIYKYKGLLLGLIYVFPASIINIFAVLVVGIYSIVLTIYLWKIIFMRDKSNNTAKFFKKYLLILFISLILICISSLCEAYLVPAIMKLVIKLFI